MLNIFRNLQRQFFHVSEVRSTLIRTAAIPWVIWIFVTGASGVTEFLPHDSKELLSQHSTEAQLKGMNGWQTRPLFTVGEKLPSHDPRFLDGYQPPGKLDGIGAFPLDRHTVRILINHELSHHEGYTYSLSNGTLLTGARISFIDLETERHQIINSGLAYTAVFDRQFQEVWHPVQINESGASMNGFSRFCSGNLVGISSHTAFVDPIYFAHEESSQAHGHGGSLWALDIGHQTLYAIPAAGRLKWENTAELLIDDDHVAMLIGDDMKPREISEELISSPLWLYLGKKNASWYEIKDSLPEGIPPPQGDFLNRNGLLVGKLYFFVSDDSRQNPEDFHGTGNVMEGHWQEIAVLDESMAGQPGYDFLGYKDDITLRREAKHLDAFQFSRPEDVSAHPVIDSRAVLASTGAKNSFHGADSWGTVYEIDVNALTAKTKITILYDGDDAGGGQFSAPDFGLRHPDNVMWANDGMIYLQEDDTGETEAFGQLSHQEASIWQLNPWNSQVRRIAQIDRSVIVPSGTTDLHPKDIGHWESSGLFDATALFQTAFGNRVFLVDVMAHGIQNGIIKRNGLVHGGQLLLLFQSIFSSHPPS